jgi:hypothetical protein
MFMKKMTAAALTAAMAAASAASVLAATPLLPTPPATTPAPEIIPNPYVVYCAYRWSRHLICTAEMWQASLGVAATPLGPQPVSIVGATLPNMGQSASAIETAFGANIAKFVAANAYIATQVQAARVIPFLARLSSDLAYYDHAGGTAALLKQVAIHTDAPTLRFYQSAFGPTLVNAALPYATAAVQASYKALPQAAPMPLSAYFYSSRGVAVSPLVTNQPAYLMDLYMEIYFLSDDTYITAMHKTQEYVNAAMPSVGYIDVMQASQPNPMSIVGAPTPPQTKAVVASAAKRAAALADGVGGVRPDGIGEVAAVVAAVVAVIAYLDPDGGKEILADLNQVDDFLFPSDPSQADPMQWLPQTGDGWDDWDDDGLGGWDFGTDGGGWDDWSDMCDGVLISCA